MKQYDLVIIGGGPAGYSAALRGADLGGSIALIEDRALGGTCLNRGCIPTKAFYQGTKLLHDIRKGDDYGLLVEELEAPDEGFGIDINKLLEFKDKNVNELVDGIKNLLNNKKIDVVDGKGTLRKDNIIEIEENSGDNYSINGEAVILATGSNPNEKIMGPELSRLCWSADALVSEAEEFWQKGGDDVVIIGGGVIGVELSSILSLLGKNVKLIEVESYLLPPFDVDIKKRVSTYLKKLGVEIQTNSVVYDIVEDESKIKLRLRKKNNKEVTVEADEVILSVGREPNLTGIDVNGLGLDLRNNYIMTDYKMRTNIDNVYAAGDIITKGKQLANVAMHQGKTAAENALNPYSDSYFDDSAIPNCVFTFPQIAEVGLTEQECKANEIPYKVGRFNFRANAKAMIMKEDGFVKIIADERTDEVLGVHIVGPNAADLIQEGTLAVKNKIKSKELTKTIHPHPTLSEAIWEASLDANEIALHQVKRKK